MANNAPGSVLDGLRLIRSGLPGTPSSMESLKASGLTTREAMGNLNRQFCLESCCRVKHLQSNLVYTGLNLCTLYYWMTLAIYFDRKFPMNSSRYLPVPPIKVNTEGFSHSPSLEALSSSSGGELHILLRILSKGPIQ
jgi:hypothetical protein